MATLHMTVVLDVPEDETPDVEGAFRLVAGVHGWEVLDLTLSDSEE
jgi:hypothetical protein